MFLKKNDSEIWLNEEKQASFTLQESFFICMLDK